VSFTEMRIHAGARRELILGGQKSGKSRAAETRAARWLAEPGHEALLVATARAGDAEMTERIARHREERCVRLPNLKTLEPGEPPIETLPLALTVWSQPHRLVVVDCLTLWLTQILMPLDGAAREAESLAAPDAKTAIQALLSAAQSAPGPLVFVSNEIGMGVSPLSSEARRFIDTLGTVHQTLAAVCDRVTLMVAGCELAVRGGPT
jgi:adenosylcobinamide kinase / adenosylcobinamide-phosphate guanylyltransferase